MIHECPRCGYATDVKFNFIKHLVNRRTPCPSTKADVSLDTLVVEYTGKAAKMYKCELCEKQFSSRSGLSYHKLHHRDNQSYTFHKIEDILNKITEHLLNSTNNIETNSGTINNINIINVHINSLGKETKDHISKDVTVKCFKRGIYGLIEMFDLIFFNADVPENHNVKLKSLKSKLVQVFKDPNWETADFGLTIDEMISITRSHIMSQVDYTEIANNMDMLQTANNMMSLSANKIKTIRNHAKARLLDRRATL